MIGIVALFSLVIVAGLAAVTVWFLKWYLHRTIGMTHRELETILDARAVPKHWADAAGVVRPSVLRNRLERLESYVRKTRLVDNEETREHLLRELASVKEEWLERYAERPTGEPTSV